MTGPVERRSKPEAVAPLTPMQQGMLFHALLDPASRAYVVQIRCALNGPLDAVALRAAWQRAVERHGVLRTAFAWQRAEGALQIVWPRATVPWRELDWTAEPPERVDSMLTDLLALDRAEGFDLARAPLVRLTLVSLAPERHVFVWTMHHIILDGWSVARVLDEVTADYAGRWDAIVPPRPFTDFVTWQSGKSPADAEAFWRSALRGIDDATSPFGRSPGPATAIQPADVMRRLDPGQTRALVALGERARVTTNTVALGAWCLVLSRTTSRRDVITGVTVAGRPPELAGVEDMVGLFINTLPFRAHVDQSLPLDEWLRDVQRRSVGLREYAHVSLVDVQEWSGLARTSALFDHLFVFENYPAGGAAGRVGELEITDVQSVEPTEYPLTIVVVPGDELTIQFSYDASRVSRTDVERLADQFVTVLDSFASAPTLPLWRHEWVGDDDRRRVTTEWNATEHAWDGTIIPHELFERQADETPDAPAVVFGSESMTYAELDARANQLAHHLVALGVAPESTVGIFMHRSMDMVVATLATLKSGAAYVPLDPAYPLERLAFMAADGNLTALLTEGALAASVPAGARAVVLVDAEWGAIATRPRQRCGVRVDPTSTLYVIYTSGSTGRPKGIVLAHEALGNLIRWHMVALRPAPHMLQFASLSFDASFHEMFAAWATGGCVYLITDDQRHDVDALLRDVASHPIDRVILPVVVLQRWAVEHGEDLSLFANLREIITTGEQLQITQPIVQLMRRLPRATLHNHYGPAETHVVTAHTLPPDHDEWPTYPPVGAPIANSTAYVLDPWLIPVPVNVSGELYLGGANLARGYAGRPELTAEKFVPNPYGPPGSRLYRTGDQARWLPDGTLEYLGRLDLMVKIRGNRVELGEVEAALGSHSSVGSCAVAVHERAPGDKRLVAYCVPADGEEIDARVLREHLAARLPDYMLPSAFVRLAALPLTPNGKIDRRALPALDEQREGNVQAVRPRDVVEEVLVRAWSDVLGVRRVGVYDHFFELGGHSLTAVQVLARVREAFGVVPPLRALFEHPRLADLANDVRAAMGAPANRAERIVPRPSDAGAAPLSPAQERLYFLQRLDPQSTAYNLAGRVRLDGPLEADAFEAAFRFVVARHDALRTRYVERDGVVTQLSDTESPFARFALRRIDLTMLDGAAASAELDRFCARELARPFDLGGEWPLRAALVALSPSRHVLSLTLHHIAGDGSSIEIVLRDLAAAYEAALRGEDAAARTKPVAYADVAAHLRERAVRGADDIEFWRESLADLEPLELPTDRPRPAVSRFRGGSIAWKVDHDLSAAIDALTRLAGCTPSVVFLTAFAELLRRYARVGEVAVAMPVSLRDTIELEDVVGLLLNTVVLRLPARDEATVRELLTSTRGVLLEAFAHRDAPFERVVDAVRPARDRARAPLAQVMFDFHAWRQDELRAGDVRLALEDVPTDTTKFDLTLVIERLDDGYTAALEFDRDLFEDATAAAMRAHLETLLRRITAEPTRRLREIEMTTPVERRELETWGRPVRTDDPPASILRLLDAATAAGADRVALADDRGALSYAELASRVERLASALRGVGIGRGSVVGLQMDRSRELVIALLAVLRAGAAFAPIDPTASEEYRAYVLTDASVSLVLTRDSLEGALRRDSVAAVPRRDRAVDPDDLAYVLYTSGSTGTPKGCQISHRALGAYVGWASRFYFEGDREQAGDCALFTAITFDLTLTSVFLPLVRGRTLTIPPAGLTVPELLHRALDDGDVIKLTPSHVMLLADAKPRTAVRVVIVGGEALTDEHVRVLERVAPRAAIFNEYGPTEATVGCVVARVTSADERIVIGRPVEHATAVVVDAHGRLAPVGVYGELLVGGASLADGYVGRPELTGERFVPDRWASRDGERLYRTGDLARWTRAGALEYAGRIDDQLKLRGFRIEPSGIAAVLEIHPGVTRAAVVGDPEGPAPIRLVAYVVTTEAIEPERLRDFLESRLPSYMVPALFVPVTAIPITAHGKLDRRALPAPERGAATSESAILPRTPTERILADIWRELLHLETVGVRDNFFELGGDSIISMQMVSRAASQGVAIDLDTAFRHQTIAAIAAAADSRAAASTTAPHRASDPISGPVRATPIQEWFFEQELANPNHFNQAALLQVVHPDARAIEGALDALYRHHDALRLVAQRDTGWSLHVAAVETARPVLLRVVDLTAIPSAQRAAEIERRSAETQRSIDLASGPPLAAVLFDCGATEPARLLLAIHHLAVDAVSWRILLEDLESVYASLVGGRPVRLAPKTASIVEWAEAYAELARDEMTARLIPELRAGSREARAIGRALGHSGDDDLVSDECEIETMLEREETEALGRELRRIGDVRLDDALLAALAIAFQPHWPAALTVDVEGHGRSPINGVDCSRTVGWFTTLFPISLPVANGTTSGALLRAVRDRARAASARAHAYGALRYLHPDRDAREAARGSSDGTILLNYHGDLDAALVASGAFTPAAESPGREKDPLGRRSHPIEVTASITGGRLRVAWVFSPRCLDEDAIARVARAHHEVLRGFIRDLTGAEPSTIDAASELDDRELSALEAELLD